MKTLTSQSPTGGGGRAKIVRAINQLQNTQVLINGLPKKYYLNKREIMREIEQDIDRIIKKIDKELS